MSDELLVKYLLDEATAAERSDVEQWIRADARNKAYFDQFRSIWDESRKLALQLNVDERAAWDRFRQRIHPENREEEVPAKVVAIPWFAIAALFVLVAGAAFFLFVFDQPGAVKQLAIQATVQPLADTLPDGSTVTLNRHSSLTYPQTFRDTVRLVQLEGEAFFDVAPDKEKPFTIQAGDVQVRVVGTSFNVQTDSLGTEVIVESGTVQVLRNGASVILQPGESVTVAKEDEVLRKTSTEDALHNYYRTRKFVCNGTPLRKLVKALNKAYKVDIRFENESLRNLPITATFSDASLDQILEIIRETFSIRVRKENDQIILW